MVAQTTGIVKPPIVRERNKHNENRTLIARTHRSPSNKFGIWVILSPIDYGRSKTSSTRHRVGVLSLVEWRAKNRGPRSSKICRWTMSRRHLEGKQMCCARAKEPFDSVNGIPAEWLQNKCSKSSKQFILSKVIIGAARESMRQNETLTARTVKFAHECREMTETRPT